uniref:Cysteine rich secreted protein n=1 Tax=Riptortus pedestris TaxID=329032 RepID=R4WDC6_RIPPE|nr:cysteine rich secreted protein [Riptortus pedestris]
MRSYIFVCATLAILCIVHVEPKFQIIDRCSVLNYCGSGNHCCIDTKTCCPNNSRCCPKYKCCVIPSIPNTK